MCLAIPGKITKVRGQKAIVQFPGESRTVFTGGEKVQEGNYVMVQMGIISKVFSKKEAHSIHLID